MQLNIAFKITNKVFAPKTIGFATELDLTSDYRELREAYLATRAPLPLPCPCRPAPHPAFGVCGYEPLEIDASESFQGRGLLAAERAKVKAELRPLSHLCKRGFLDEHACFCDAAAHVALHICLSAEIAVPEEIALLGVDNDPMLSRILSLTLSSIDLQVNTIGHEAGLALLKWIENGRRPSGDKKLRTARIVTRRPRQRDLCQPDPTSQAFTTGNSHPLRYSRLINESASGSPLTVRLLLSHSIGLPSRSARLPSSTTSVSLAEYSKFAPGCV